METGTAEAGCIFREHGHECRKLTESGTLMCPHHNLMTKYREDEKEQRQAKPKPRHKKKPVQNYAPYPG